MPEGKKTLNKMMGVRGVSPRYRKQLEGIPLAKCGTVTNCRPLKKTRICEYPEKASASLTRVSCDECYTVMKKYLTNPKGEAFYLKEGNCVL